MEALEIATQKEPAASLGLRAPLVQSDLLETVGELLTEAPAGHTARTLIKFPDLRVVLVAMHPGSALHEHRTFARITVQVLVGHVRFHVDGAAVELRMGDLISLDRGLPHDVEALEESAFLLTLTSPHAG